MVRAVTLGRAGAAISGLAEVVRYLGSDALPAADGARGGGDVEHAPVAEGAARRIGVVDDQSEAFRAGRRLAPMQCRRLVRAVAGILCRDRLAVLKGVAGQGQFGEGSVLHGWSSIR